MTSRLRIYLIKGFLLRMIDFWVFLTVVVFSIGVIELVMSRGGSTSSATLIDAFVRRTEDVAEYLNETMAYAGYAGFLIGFWALNKSRELQQIRLLGGTRVLVSSIIVAGAFFGLLQVLVISPFASEISVRQENVRLVRKNQDEGQAILFAKKYNTSSGVIHGGAKILILDNSFNLRTIYSSEKGKITKNAWTLEKNRQENYSGQQKTSNQKIFPIETDMNALANALQVSTRELSIYNLPAAYKEARINAQSVRPFVNRALFFIHLPLTYIAFGLIAYAIALYLQPRGIGIQIVLLIIFLPSSVKFLQHILWTQVGAGSLPAVLPTFGLPLAFCCAVAFSVRTQRLFI